MKLHDYQEVAVDYLRGRDRAGLLLDMGLGKTAASLSALEPRHLPVLVTAPKRVATDVWPTEARLWRPDLRVEVAKGLPAHRKAVLASEQADVVVLGRDNLRDVAQVRRARPFQTVIIDELSGFKTRNSVRWKTAKRIVAGVPHVWGLTGTPSPNGMMDLWAQIYLLDGGARLGRTLSAFRSRFFTPGRQLANGTIIEWNLREGAEARIHELIEDLCLYMGAEGRIKLPPVTYNVIEVDLPIETKRIYRKMKHDLVVDLRSVFADGEQHSARNAAVLTNKLSQISAGFLYVDDADLHDGAYQLLHREKVRAVQEIVEGTGSPVLVFYRYSAERELLQEAFGEAARTIDEEGVIDAWNEGRVPVLLAHPASAGHGLNLQYGGHTIVWTTLDWSLEFWEQGNGRLARQGQRHPVVIHAIMARRTVDHLIRASLTDKAIVQDRLLDHLESPI